MFRHTASRFAQVSKTTNPTPTLDAIHQLPTSTGAGLFVEHAKFEPLGTPPTLLHVSLPASSVLNARTRSLVAANGDLSGVTQKLGVLNLWQKPILYNEVSSTKPLSLLLSNAKGFVNLEMSGGEEWTVMNTDDVAGWYGSLELNRASGVSAGVKVTAHDKGNLLLTGKSQVFTVQLEEGESINVNPGSIVAYTGTPAGFHKLKSLELPTFGVWNTVKSYTSTLIEKIQSQTKQKEEIKPEPTELKGNEVIEVAQPSVWNTVKEWTVTKFNTLLFKNRLFYELRGPATIIIQNDFTPLSKTFTQSELQEIYKSFRQ